MIYRGKFPAENYTQTRPADLPLKGNRLSVSLARRVARVKPTRRGARRVAIRIVDRGEIVIRTPRRASFLSEDDNTHIRRSSIPVSISVSVTFAHEMRTLDN